MAEAFLRALAGNRFDVHSAGLEATQVRLLAVRAMAEEGIDIAGHASKTLERYLEEPFDFVVTVCAGANERCPVFPRAKARLHWPFPDPAEARGTEKERLEVFRDVRDAIRTRIEEWIRKEEKGIQR
jgi:arsenate reductase